MSLQRRILLYALGLILGGFLAVRFYGDRLTNADWLPESRVKKRLSITLIDARPEARAQLQQWPAQLADLRRAMDGASIDIAASKRTPDSIYYRVHAAVNGRDALLVVAVLRDIDRDTTATLWEIAPR
jgi:hypothetical protein